MKLESSIDTMSNKQITINRWQMSRAGILNFWYYDDEEFHIDEGRIIFRGTNGSGKSVTMQSFIPLVLDGDKRPERLDPFGSRDRRLEYYLLGDGEQGHTDRTGYLWLEFYHTQKEIYKTIGIGIRARRGVTQLGFWGFLLEDGRRINQDFWLYDRNLWLEQKKKVALGRKLLEEKISAGGQVVLEQSSYRDMVNKTFFGFQDPNSYKDLLKLLLELRSPKLSKDFKPSAIYEILTNALPPLMDDELNPLSDVMEDMDQITDRLDELQTQRKELEKLNTEYGKYNRFLLKQHSENTLKQFEEYDRLLDLVSDLEQQKNEVMMSKEDVSQALDDQKANLNVKEAELDVLNRSEAMEKQRELEFLEEQISDAKKQLVGIEERLNINLKRAEKIKEDITLSESQLNRLSDDQKILVEEMEDMARIIEFREHDIYYGIWSRGLPLDGHWLENWKSDLSLHKRSLVTALETARAEREASRATAEAEVRLGEIVSQRNLVEEEKIEQENQLEKIKDEIRENLIRWQQGLQYLSVKGEGLRESLLALSLVTVKERQYNPVRLPAENAFEQDNQILLQQILNLQQQKHSLQEECSRIEKDLEQWRSTKEPEPFRTDGRSASRSQRGYGAGAPLYTVCEFNSSLTEKEQAQLEETLEQAGLLDAWIFPGGIMGLLHPGEEEVWIEPNQAQGETLSKVLHATPSITSGLSTYDVQLALDSFSWSQDNIKNNKNDENKGMIITGDGKFQFGPLVGTNRSKERAEFIGKETRLRTKELEINRLEATKQCVLSQIFEVQQELVNIEKKKRFLKEELERFPNDKELQNQFDLLIQLSYRLNEVMNQEQKVETWYKEKVSSWRSLQLKLHEQTADWTTLKHEKSIDEAIELSSTYNGCISELYSLWTRYHDYKRQQLDQLEQQEDLSGLIDEDINLRQDIEARKRKYSIQIDQISKLISEMGIEEIHKKIMRLKEEKISLQKVINDLSEKREKLGNDLSVIVTKLDIHLGQLQEGQNELRGSMEKWKVEMSLGLLPEWRENLDKIDDEKSIRKLCRQIISELGSLFVNTTRERLASQVEVEYQSSKQNLQEYSFELERLASDRIIITSKRDRINPLSPSNVLEELLELENEQRILLTEKDRQLYEEIILSSVGKAIRYRIHRAKDWVKQMNDLMEQRNTSSGLKLSLEWEVKKKNTEFDLDTETLVELLMRDAHRLDDDEIERVVSHFRTRVMQAKQEAEEVQGSLRKYIYDLLDYRSWFEFKLYHRKGEQTGYKELSDSKFNVLSGGEKAMAMYIPLFAATYSRYSDASEQAPKIISLDEAFAGVDDGNMRDIFQLLTDMGFDYMMTSQVLWGCYDTVPRLSIYEIYRPKGINVVTLFHYIWNGKRRILVESEA